MERVYENPTDKSVDFFVGTEVENTPAKGKLTLFVVGVHTPEKILDVINERKSLLDTTQHITHVYFGANMSFPKLDANDGPGWKPWEEMIMAVLGTGLWATLDIDVSCVEGLHESGLTENNRFIPMISVKVPYVGLFNYNTTIKVDDKTFDATNPGVWCWSLHDLMSRDHFTDWSKYQEDKVL